MRPPEVHLIQTLNFEGLCKGGFKGIPFNHRYTQADLSQINIWLHDVSMNDGRLPWSSDSTHLELLTDPAWVLHEKCPLWFPLKYHFSLCRM